MARWHDRPPAACATRHRGPGLAPGWLAQDRDAGASLPDRALSALHPSGPGEVPDPDRQPAVRDGVRTRLPRQRRSLPPPHRLLSAALGGGSLSTSAQPARRVIRSFPLLARQTAQTQKGFGLWTWSQACDEMPEVMAAAAVAAFAHHPVQPA